MGLIKGFSDPEDELYDAVYREVASLRRAPDSEKQTFANDDLDALRRMAGSSVLEIDRLVGELQTLRDLLETERERVQRELDDHPNPAKPAALEKCGAKLRDGFDLIFRHRELPRQTWVFRIQFRADGSQSAGCSWHHTHHSSPCPANRSPECSCRFEDRPRERSCRSRSAWLLARWQRNQRPPGRS